MSFQPIAIVGQGCVLPGALTPETLWELVREGRSALGSPPPSTWRLDPGADRRKLAEEISSDVGGHVTGFAERFDPTGFAVPASELAGLDPVFLWSLHAGREALRSAGLDPLAPKPRGAVVLGNLGYPTPALVDFALQHWAGETPSVAPDNRFMSGLPAHLLARALGCSGGSFALDAACASSLYAIKLACDRLHDGAAELVLAGGVNHADDLFLHGGFSALHALSPTGQSRPFHRDADGLVPARGAAILALMRLSDARASGRPILGLIRGVGLSNDGRSRGLMVPSEEGQVRALRAAYEVSGVSPADVSLVECHATGTVVGDGCELRSMRQVFAGARGLPIGSLKSNLGHLITASGGAAIIKVLAAMKHRVRPPTRHADAPLDELQDGTFRLLEAEEPWESRGPRLAAISNFGFGGNNAHLILEEWNESAPSAPASAGAAPAPVAIAVVARSVQLGDDQPGSFAARVLGRLAAPAAPVAEVAIEAAGLRFPPADLRAALPQQLLLFQAAQRLGAALTGLPATRTSLYVGMGVDAEIARHAIRWCGDRRWVGSLDETLRNEPLTAPAVIGCMPNIVANRIGHQLGFHGPSFTVSAEEASGNVALELAIRALRAGEVDAAVVGAVDLSVEPVHARAAAARLPAHLQAGADAAVLLVLKRHDDAVRDGDEVLALVGGPTDRPAGLTLSLGNGETGLSATLGHAHAASGLLHVAAALEACASRALPAASGPVPWLPSSAERRARIQVATLGGGHSTIELTAATGPAGHTPLPGPSPRMGGFAAASLGELAASVAARQEGGVGRFRLAVFAESAAAYEARLTSAAALLRDPGFSARRTVFPDGIHFGAEPLAGELAFVFTGAAGAYPNMGRELALALPELVDGFAARAQTVRAAAGWVYGDGDDGSEATPLQKLWGASYLSQLHAELTRKTLGLEPQAAIGYCSGETNSLFALDVWSDLDGFRADIDASRVYEQHLCGELSCLRTAWKLPEDSAASWSTWRVRAPAAEVREAVAREPRVRLVITNTESDVVIAGDPAGCERVGAVFGRKAARTPGYDFIMHCEEAREYESRWRALHTRPSTAPAGVRFYTHATLSSYTPSDKACAAALTGQAMNHVNFPALVLQAWEDGVRIFVEHGPHAGCTKWIDEILGEREHLAVALDRFGTSPLLQALESTARLFAAGVNVELHSLARRLATAAAAPEAASPRPNLRLAVPGHQAPIPPRPAPERPEEAGEWLAPAPRLAAVLHESGRSAPLLASVLQEPGRSAPLLASGAHEAARSPGASSSPPPAAAARQPAPAAAAVLSPFMPASPRHSLPEGAVFLDRLALRHGQLADVHRAFLRQQFELQQRFAAGTLAPIAALARAGAGHPAPGVERLAPAAFAPAAPAALLVSPLMSSLAPPAPLAASPAPAAPRNEARPPLPASLLPPATNGAPAGNGAASGSGLAPARLPAAAAPSRLRAAPPRAPTGPRFSRADLEIHAGGEISRIFGELFRQQDGYARQVRMPEPPLLLADRVLGIEGEPGTLGLGTIWTETDVKPDAFYLHEGRMPAGILVESGQADLMLISWLGTDFLNKGERVYRLLGCELECHGELPKPGDTLHYQITVDGHAEQAGIRLFFFHYDCWVNGELRMTVRSGQAGFFTNEELASSAGVLWSAATAKPKKDARLDPPAAVTQKRSLSSDDVTALIDGRVAEVFGPAFARADTHTRTPTIAGGKMRLLDEVLEFDPAGGPWKRGYLKTRLALTPESWFFAGHFKNDPCMPGTLMLEGGLQAMQILMMGLGHTLRHDGGRFEPLPGQNYSLRCRGQATPVSKEVITEIFVEEIVGGAEPILYAEILGSVDGRKAFHCKRMALRLVPAWPLDQGRLLAPIPEDDRPVAVVDGFRFDYSSLLACAWARPSLAFGPMYSRFDSPRRVARLPGPPYHFMSRVARVEGPIGGLQQGSFTDIEYDVPAGEWYFEVNAARAMPFAVLLEAALQPCGWLASYVGGALGADETLHFRNLDGTGTQHVELGEDIGTIRVTTKLTSISNADSTVIMSFEVVMRAGERELYTLRTLFGFFPGHTMENQAGLATTNEQRTALGAPGGELTDLLAGPARFFEGTLRLATGKLLMIERLTGLWRTGGKKGLGRLRAEKSIAASQWFFKAHFFQDPVQPGSLGIEAMLQAVQALAIELGLGEGLPEPRFETQAVGVPMTWKYRGQVLPENRLVVVDVELTEVRRDEQGVLAVAEGSLWVDGKRIYEARGLGVRIVSGPPAR